MVDQIGKHNPCAPACAVNCRSQPFGILAGIMSVQHDVITGPRKSKRDGGADAPARSSDERRAREFFAMSSAMPNKSVRALVTCVTSGCTAPAA